MEEKLEKEKRLPNIGEYVRGLGTLVSIVDRDPPPPPPPTKDYIFEEISARCEVRLNGKKLKELNTFNDYYGKETSVEIAISEAKEYAERNKIGPNSDVEVVAIKIVEQFKKVPTDKTNFYSTEHLNFESLKSGASWGLPDPTEEVVWSSKNTNEGAGAG